MKKAITIFGVLIMALAITALFYMLYYFISQL
ncbi:hypothetical protein PBAC_17150 [Pedobacter glucosidilyticus]|nr:hypothetical protein PBAC_17150 [Pedobacter glucosidilyticus]